MEKCKRQTQTAARHLGNRSLRGPCGSILRTAYTTCELSLSAGVFVWLSDGPEFHQLKRILRETRNEKWLFCGNRFVRAPGAICTVSFEALCMDRCKHGVWKRSTRPCEGRTAS